MLTQIILWSAVVTAMERIERMFEFEEFCRLQRARLTSAFKRSEQRINRARWGTGDEEEAHYVITRKGTTETSAPLSTYFRREQQ